MSKIGNQLIKLPETVNVKVADEEAVVKGDKGEIKISLPRGITVKIKDGELVVERKNDSKKQKALHGTIRALIANAVFGVTEGWEKKLEMVGTGYRAAVDGKGLNLTVGFSHPVEINKQEGITFSVEKAVITVAGIDKESVGQVAAKIRAIRPPEPYKGKGIRYVDEVVRRKPGKAAKGAEGA